MLERIFQKLEELFGHVTHHHAELDAELDRRINAATHHLESLIMTKFDELQAAFAAMLAAQATVLADIQAKLATSIENSGADSSHFDALIAQVNDATVNLKAIDDSLKGPASPASTDPTDPAPVDPVITATPGNADAGTTAAPAAADPQL